MPLTLDQEKRKVDNFLELGRIMDSTKNRGELWKALKRASARNAYAKNIQQFVSHHQSTKSIHMKQQLIKMMDLTADIETVMKLEEEEGI